VSGYRPRTLLARVPCEEDEFVSLHFPSGRSRDAARRLWRALEHGLGLDLRGLQPDDDLDVIIQDSSEDSLSSVEVAKALGEELGVSLGDTEGGLRSFRQCVNQMTGEPVRLR
jgi:hypothetical protein